MKSIAKFLLKRKLVKQKRKVHVHNLNTAKSALLLYDATDENKEKQVRDFARFLKEEGVKVTSLGFYSKKGKNVSKPKDELDYHYFDPNELSWLKQPNFDKANNYIKTDYDLLIDLNLEGYFPLQYISSLSKAKFKVGAAGGYRNTICDLTLNLKEQRLIDLIEQIKVYLNMINKRA